MHDAQGGKVRRLWLEIEVEVVDEIAMEASARTPSPDPSGNRVAGPQPAESLLSSAVGRPMIEALRNAEQEIGVRLLWVDGPHERRSD